MTLRLAVGSDAATLSDLHCGSFPDGWSSNDFATWLSRPESFAVLESRERDAVAFGLALAAGDDAELLTIATRADARRQGMGRRIFHGLDAEAQRRGLTRWVLEVASNNNPAQALYESEGFMEIAVRKAYYRQGEARADARVLARPVGLVSGHAGC